MPHVRTASGTWALRPSTLTESSAETIESVLASALWAVIYGAWPVILLLAAIGALGIAVELIAVVW
jgi:hypothetical protein